MECGVNLSFDLFILHHPTLQSLVQHIEQKLRGNSFTLAPYHTTVDDKEHLIANSRLILVCLSEQYINTESYNKDVELLERYAKGVILLRFDTLLPEPKLKTRARRQINFQRATCEGSEEFSDAVEKLVNCVHTVLNEYVESNPKSPPSSSAPQHCSQGHGSQRVTDDVLPRTDVPVQGMQSIPTPDELRNNSIQTHHIDTIDKQMLDRPLKELPGLVMLSRLLDPMTDGDRVIELASCYEFTATEVQHIQGTNVSNETPAFAFLRFLESSNPDTTIGQLRRCLNERRDSSTQALGVINMYTDEQTISDISWLDSKSLGASGFDWRFVADHFGHGAQIRDFEIPSAPLTSRFDILCDMIAAQFPEHTVGDFLDNLRKLQYVDVVRVVLGNMDEHDSRTRGDGDEEFTDLR